MYKVGICDEEESTCIQLKKIIQDCFHNDTDLVTVYVWHSAKSCCKDMKSEIMIDFLFLETSFSDKNGVDIGKFIRNELKNDVMQIIFISSITKLSVQLFEVHPYDFIVKPVKKERVELLLQKLINLSKHDKCFFSFCINKNRYKVPFEDILFLASNDKHIEIFLTQDKKKTYRGKLSDEAGKLPIQFAVIGKSYIINMNYVIESHYDYVIMSNGIRINISQKYRKVFKEKLQEFYNELI